jgi:hypothetical protein
VRYTYRGDRFTDPALKGQPCDPVRRPDGRCVTGGRLATMLVQFSGGRLVVVLRRQLRIMDRQNNA